MITLSGHERLEGGEAQARIFTRRFLALLRGFVGT